ncbi:MAG: hypothetical protein U0228_26080 [Myxococcaceae bacterium]
MLAFLLLTLSSVPDGGVVVTRSHDVRWVATQQFRARVDVERLSTAQRTATVEVLSVTSADGGTTPALERINEALASFSGSDVLGDVESSLARGVSDGTQGITVSLPVVRGPFLWATICVDFVGPYPSLTCDDLRFRTDTGEKWSWEEAIARKRHAALRSECKTRLARAARAERARVSAEPPDEEWWAGALAVRCEPDDLRDFALTPDGGLRFTVFRGPHVSGNFSFGFTLEARELPAWVDPRGPLAKAR